MTRVALSAAYDDSKVLINGQTLPLVASTIDLYTAVPVPDDSTWLTPMVFFWILAALVLLFTLWQIQYNKLNFLFDKILFTIVGLTGWLILLLWFGTDHGVTAWNYDILWAFPLWFPFIWSISKTNKPAWFQFALIGYAVLLLLATGNILKHNYVVIPILLTLIIRVYYMNNSLSNIPQKKTA